MTPDADFWQREASRASDAAARSANRVYLILSFGLAATTALLGGAAFSRNALVLAFVPLLGLFITALVGRSTIESVYMSGFQAVAERNIRAALHPDAASRLLIWRADGEEPAKLRQYNWATAVTGIVGLTIMSLAADIAAVQLNDGLWRDSATSLGNYGIWLCLGVQMPTLLVLLVAFILAWSEKKNFFTRYFAQEVSAAQTTALREEKRRPRWFFMRW